jgi:hypothetical protein
MPPGPPPADADPLSLRGTIHRSCFRLWSTQRQKAFPCQSRSGHLEIVRRNGEKAVRTLTVATPNLFDEWMVCASVLESDELALVLHYFI